VKRGDITQTSFGFRTIKDEWNEAGTERELIEAELRDVSPVTFPAYPQTKVSARAEEALRDIGVDFETLMLVTLRLKRGVDLDVVDIDAMRSAIEILSGYVPESQTDHSDQESEREHSETTEEPEQSTPTGQTRKEAHRARKLALKYSRGVES